MWVRCGSGLFAVVLLCAPRVHAAQARATARLPDGVRLVVRPRVGDTLRLVMEQSIELRPHGPSKMGQDGARVGDEPPVASPARDTDIGPRRTQAAQRLTRVQLFAHSLVEASDPASTTMLATTDSMLMWTGPVSERKPPQYLLPPADSRTVRVRVTPDGAMRVSNPPPGAMELGATLSAMPGMLPEGLVHVGDKWDRDVPLPSVPVNGFRADGYVRASFCLDSLTRRGRSAWISMHGTLRRDGAGRDLPVGTRVITAGTMDGTLVVDLDRAWIVDARTVIDVQSDVQSDVQTGPPTGVSPSGVSPSAGVPVLLDLRIRQRVRAR